MSEDMSDMMSKISQMLNSNDMPVEIKNIVSQLSNNQSSGSDMSSHNSSNNYNNSKSPNNSQNFSEKNNNYESNNSKSSNNENSSDNKSQNNGIPDFDINTMLRMKSIIDSMKSQKDDPRANLLMSLKPYLKPSRKQKVDQYVKLFQMGKVIEVLNPLGGDNNHDV